jgi:tetratricopeptide (TPR) repeat protein
VSDCAGPTLNLSVARVGIRQSHRSRPAPRGCHLAALIHPTALAVRALILALLLPIILACSEDTDIRTRPVQLGSPVEARLEDAAPEVRELLKRLLEKTLDDLASGPRRGELGMGYEANGFISAALASYAQAEQLEQGNARWSYHQAQILGMRGQTGAALQALQRSMAIDDTRIPAWMWLGTWSLDEGLLDQAAEAFAKAESLGLGWAARASQARVLLRQHHPDEAIALLEPLSLESPFPSVYQLLGRAYRAAGHVDEAQIALTQGRAAQPIAWLDQWQSDKQTYEVAFPARVQHAQRLVRLGRHDEAVRILEELLDRDPDSASVINTLGNAYVRIGERDRAFWLLRRAIDRNPNQHSLHLNIARFYESRGDVETAMMHVDRATELHPVSSTSHARKGALLLKQRKYEDALNAFELALTHDASDARLFLQVGEIEALLKRWSEAAGHFEASTSIDPTLTAAHLSLARALAESKRFEEARAALEPAIRLGAPELEVRQLSSYIAELEGAQD